MKKNSKYKDKKINVFTFEDFFSVHNYFNDVEDIIFWNEDVKPEPFQKYYKFDDNQILYIEFGCKFINFGTKIEPNLDHIDVLERDGFLEYELLNKELLKLKKYNSTKSKEEKIKRIEYILTILPNFVKKNDCSVEIKYEDNLFGELYKTSNEEIKNKYLVFDVETNGLRKNSDDLLSFSIYDPTLGECYNRFFPLENQPIVLTTYINGISSKKLNNYSHMTQKEFNWLNEYFDMKNKTILTYSGGKGEFDSQFLKNYLYRNNITGFEELKFANIKNIIHPNTYYMFEDLSKDNLCKALRIEGVQDVHSSFNDCILEWKLFEKFKTEKLFFKQNIIYKYNDGYVVPFSYLYCDELKKYANISTPQISTNREEIYTQEFTKKEIKDIKKFSSNITGISLENIIFSKIGANKEDNSSFLFANNKKLQKIACIYRKMHSILVSVDDFGMLEAKKEEDKALIDEVNESANSISKIMKPTIDYIKNDIFENLPIKSQELSISDDGKIFAICDLSNEYSVLEIKTFKVLDENDMILDSIAEQLYYESKGRKSYILSIVFDQKRKSTGEYELQNIKVHLYKVNFNIKELN